MIYVFLRRIQKIHTGRYGIKENELCWLKLGIKLMPAKRLQIFYCLRLSFALGNFKRDDAGKLINILLMGIWQFRSTFYRCEASQGSDPFSRSLRDPIPRKNKICDYNKYWNLNSKSFIWKKLDVPKIETINVKPYEFKQSPYPQADKLPFRSIICSSSQVGKGVTIQNLILKF